VLSDDDVSTLASRLTKEFKKFPKLDAAAQKTLIIKYVNAIHVTWEREPVKFNRKEQKHLKAQGRDYKGKAITLIFDVKVGTVDFTPDADTAPNGWFHNKKIKK